MDNNFNAQPNNMGANLQKPMQQQPMQQQPVQQQPMYQQPVQQQPMYQQPVQQQPMYQTMPAQPKKKTGLIIALIAGAVALIAIIAIVLVLVLSGGDDLIGTWTYTEDGQTASFEFKDDNTGTMGSMGFNLPMEWKRDGDKLSITMTFFGQSSTESFTIKKLEGDTLVLANDDEEITLTRAD